MRAQLLALLILADTLVLLALILVPRSGVVAIVVPVALCAKMSETANCQNLVS